jgi:WXG100 family type VII secretion target
MPGPGYQSDAAAMSKAVTGFDQSAAETRSSMNALETALENALRQNYQGAQAQSFFKLHLQIQDSAKQVGMELDTMSHLIRESATNYDTGDTDVASSLNSLAAQVGDSPILGRLSGA